MWLGFAEECECTQYEVDTYEIKKIMKKRLEEMEEDENQALLRLQWTPVAPVGLLAKI